MAVTLTQAELSAALRLTTEPEDIAEATRLLAYASLAVEKYAPDAPDLVQNEGVIRVCGYLFDMPFAARSDGYANAMRNSGAARLLLPYRIHRAGSTGEAVATAQAAVGTLGNPVTDLAVERGLLVVTFSDGSTLELPLPSAREVGQTDIFDARLPGAAVAMRMGWTFGNVDPSESTFIRDGNHPNDGAAEGTTAELLTPPIPPVLLADPKAYRFQVWIAGDVGLVALLGPYGDNWLPEFPTSVELTVDGVDGLVYSERHTRTNEDGLYSFVGVIPGELIATQPWVETQLAGITPGGMFGGVDQTARDAAEAAQGTADSGVRDATAAQQTADDNTEAIADIDIPDVVDWSLTGDTSRIPTNKIPISVQGHRVYVTTSTPAVGQIGDIWIQDLTTSHPRIYEHDGSGYQLDYSFHGGRVHFTSQAQSIALNEPIANAGDMLFTLVAGTLNLYRRLFASSPPYWASLGTVAGGGGGGGGWYWAGHVTGGAWVANTARNASLLGFPLAGLTDYAALRTAVLDGTVKQIAIRISQNDPNGADDDVGIYIVPNISGFFHGAVGNYRAFPAWGIGVDPIKFDVKFDASHLTIKADAAITSLSGVFVRIGIWA